VPSYLLARVALHLCDLGKYSAGRSRIAQNAIRLPPSSRRSAMQSRTSHSHVTFRRPFRLAGMERSAPAGRYKVTLEEEQLDSLTVEAWRQTSVALQIASAGATDYLSLDPMDLRDALLRDGDDSIDPTTPVPGARLREVLKLRHL
jgi:hypothetical protein